MQYREVCEFYNRLENTTKRLEMIDIFANLLSNLSEEKDAKNIDRVIYLTQGKLYPDWTGKPEIGIAEKMAINAIAIALGISNKQVTTVVNITGDIGIACEQLLSTKRQTALFQIPLTIQNVYESLERIALAQGPGSADFKVRTLAGLINAAVPLEARYLLRTVTGSLRLGIAEMTVIDALAIAFTGSKDCREKIERAYNLTSDLGQIAGLIAFKGLKGIDDVHVTLGKPIRMMAAQKLSTAQEIVEKLQGQLSGEWKLDGERMQIHKDSNDITIFSRRLEQITSMYPDVIQLAKTQLKAKQCIVEGEAVAVDKENQQKLLPFQILMRRRRKYKIDEMVAEIPVAIFFFDCLYANGNDLTQKPYLERRTKLEQIVRQNNFTRLVPATQLTTSVEIDKMFRDALTHGCEGLIIKSTSPDSIYRAGARSWLWVKLKESYQAQAIGPVDLVVVGAFWGRGRRAKTYGALLAAVRDEQSGEFKTVCKVGTGFSDEELEHLPERFKEYMLAKKDPLVDSTMKADLWFQPAIILQVVGDEITRSPVHTCAFNQVAPNEGLAIRFPRFDGTWRYDKSPDEATSVDDIIEAYKGQSKVK
ncbi:MAG: ATP-dependent DNA ligase [Candidatus Thorarchaeota archaeon]